MLLLKAESSLREGLIRAFRVPEPHSTAGFWMKADAAALCPGQDTGKGTSETPAAYGTVLVPATASGAGVGKGLSWLSEMWSPTGRFSLFPGGCSRVQPQAVHGKKAAAGGAGRQQ